jgi:hypothetical protein
VVCPRPLIAPRTFFVGAEAVINMKIHPVINRWVSCNDRNFSITHQMPSPISRPGPAGRAR